MCNKCKEKFQVAREKTRETIEDHPFASVAIAAGVGAVLGIATSETIRAIKRRRY